LRGRSVAPCKTVDPNEASSAEIVRRSGSNLAFALAVLPAAVREDMRVFYAFCRVVDDIADAPGLALASRRAGLERWRLVVEGACRDLRAGVESEFDAMRKRRRLPADLLLAIVEGVEMDLEPRCYADVDDLKAYCYHVACAVGLVSAEIFGCRSEGAKRYAVELGYALQWTNILRDVGEDAREGRVYLPLAELERYGLSQEALLSLHPDRARFERLMKQEARRARAFYEAAVAALPGVDRAAMRSAELMRRIYHGILETMETDGFRVFEKRYRLSKATMMCHFLRAKFLP